ncbi:MAG: hypothetical protein R2788_23670 [Saprospiraceae bacterium]
MVVSNSITVGIEYGSDFITNTICVGIYTRVGKGWVIGIPKVGNAIRIIIGTRVISTW